MQSPHLAVVESPPPEGSTKTLAVAKPVELLPPEAAYQQMRAMAKDIFDSRLMPKTIGNWQATFAVIQKGRELGIPPMAAIEGISIIEGKPACGAHLMLALVKRDYGPGAIRVAKTDATECVVEWREVGWSGTSSFRFALEDAQRAKLTGKDVWQRYPAAMLRARAISAVVKMAFPEVVGGMMLPDELGADVTVTAAGDVVIVDPGRSEPERPAARPSTEAAATAEPIDVEEITDYRLPAEGTKPAAEDTPTTFWTWARSVGVGTPAKIAALIGRPTDGLSWGELRTLIVAARGRQAEAAAPGVFGPGDAAAETAPHPVAVGLSLDDRPSYVRMSDGTAVDPQTGEIVEDQAAPPSLNHLHGLGAERGLDHDALHRLAVHLFGVASMTELEQAEVDDLETLVKQFEPKEWAALLNLLDGQDDTGYQILLGYAEQICDAKTVKDCQAVLKTAADGGIVNTALSGIATRRMGQLKRMQNEAAP